MPQMQHFNPRTPCGVRRFRVSIKRIDFAFQSTHSMRSATMSTIMLPIVGEFQSTHSMRSATSSSVVLVCAIVISIHALHAECDPKPTRTLRLTIDFNPRTPCGVRPKSNNAHFCSLEFQSTHSMRSATSVTVARSSYNLISIHALHAECDCCQ